MSLIVLVPTKGRPANALRLAQAVKDTCNGALTSLMFAIDPGENCAKEYESLLKGVDPRISVVTVLASPQRIGPILNHLAIGASILYDYVGFLGDDHLPRTANWDEKLISSLGNKPGVAYGNDLLQGANLPTAGIISSDIIRALGYMVPACLEHLYLDDFWKTLGQGVGNLVYRDDLIIEHLHPTVSKASYDATYQEANAPEQYARDGGNYQNYLNTQWAGELARLRERLNLD